MSSSHASSSKHISSSLMPCFFSYGLCSLLLYRSEQTLSLVCLHTSYPAVKLSASLPKFHCFIFANEMCGPWAVSIIEPRANKASGLHKREKESSYENEGHLLSDYWHVLFWSFGSLISATSVLHGGGWTVRRNHMTFTSL